MDPLSSVLSLLKPRNYLSAGLDAGGDWAIQFPDQHDGIKTGAVVSGSCWLEVGGVSDPVHLEAGDCFLLPSGRPFRLASDLAIVPVEAREVFASTAGGSVARLNGGGAFSVVSNRFGLSGRQSGFLLGMLPPIVHIRDAKGRAALFWSIQRIMAELRDPQPGGFLIVDHLAHLILVEALRLHLADAATARIGWLFALADEQISRALQAIHGNPERGWTVQDLAKLAGMSRSAFALKFKTMVGTSPMGYLAHWRMALASHRFTTSRDPISTVAQSLGYESEAAFSTAFKRIMGHAPRRYSREAVSCLRTRA
ncbi:MAG: AraC family transcriptional regulator [Pseudorhodobacter sp. PARRP1]|nr:MAG: AraC family transcriptional regulator [Pseudorhodobacter sp. PARRP1]